MSEARQRWRIAFSRGEEAQFLSHLDAVKLWERAFRRGGIPVATTEGFNPRPRLIFAAPLPLGTLAEHDLADLFLSERLTLRDIRTRLERGMPRGYRLVDVHDEWTGAAALATQLVAADYRMTVLGCAADGLEVAIRSLLGAERLDREKRRDTKPAAYDLRPLLIELRTADPAPEALRDLAGEGPMSGLWMRLRHSQDLGSGRPEEVVAALAEAGRDAEGAAVPEAAHAVPEAGAVPEAPHAMPEAPRAVPGAPRAAAEPSGPPPTAHQAAGALSLEAILPIRERLWLADELPA